MSRAPAVDYALKIIALFAEKACPLGITEIASALDINKNAVSRILEALMEEGWIYLADPGRKKYALTLKPFSLLSTGGGQSLSRLARPEIEALQSETGDSAYLAVLDGDAALYLLHFESTRDVRINGRTGGRYPLHCSAPGKALLAFADEETRLTLLDHPLEKRSANTTTDVKALLEECERIRSVGYALDIEEFGPGILCFAAPVFDASGCAVAAVGLSTLTFYRDKESLVNEAGACVLNAARAISEKLGGRA